MSEENYMSLDESYSGNVDEDDDNKYMDIDDSYAENGSQMDADVYYGWNIVDDYINQSDVDVSYDESSSKGHVAGPSGKDEHDVGDECKFDVGYDEFQQESLDTHWKVMVTTFMSEEEVYDFYNAHAKERGFGIRRDLLRRKRVLRELCALGGFCVLGLENDKPSFVPWKGGPVGSDRRVVACVKPI